MEYYVKSVVPIIEKNYDKFTTVEKSIADFFIHNQEKVDLSSKAMADRLYVSEASLSRFAQKCGYRGYREFVYQYEVTFVEKQESMTGNTRMILNSYDDRYHHLPDRCIQHHVLGYGVHRHSDRRIHRPACDQQQQVCHPADD